MGRALRADNMGPKAKAKAPRMDVAEDGLEEGAAGGVPVIIHPRKGHLRPADMDSITGMLQQCLHFQHNLSERWEKETVKQEKRRCHMQIQVK